jgi:hypothetical protein
LGLLCMDMPETYGGAGLTLRSMHCSSKNFEKGDKVPVFLAF